MHCRYLGIGAVALLAVLLWTGFTLAEDVLPLGTRGDADTLTLDLKEGEDADTIAVHGWRYLCGRSCCHSHYRTVYYSGYSYPRCGGYACARPWIDFGLSFVSPPCYGPRVEFYAPPVYYYPQPCASPVPYEYSPTSRGLRTTLSATVVIARPRAGIIQPADPVPLPHLRTAPPENTYPYDGGPQDPVPQLKIDPVPSQEISTPKPAEGRVVSLSNRTARYSYPAFGEQARVASPHEEPAIPLKGQVVRKTNR